jgi:predicted esterase
VGKKILTVHGEKDLIVPIGDGEGDIQAVLEEVGEKGEVEVWVVDGLGHVLTPEMVKRTAEWVWKWAMVI